MIYKRQTLTLLFKIGNKSFNNLAPVYGIDLKPYVVVLSFDCSTFAGYLNE